MYGSTATSREWRTSCPSMNCSSLANNCQNSHYPFGTSVNYNCPPATSAPVSNQRLYAIVGEVNRVASSFLTAQAAGLTLGTAARDNRDAAFAEFLNGVAIGYVALLYDSLGVVSVGMSTQDAGKLIGYKAAGDSALRAPPERDRLGEQVEHVGRTGSRFPRPGFRRRRPTRRRSSSSSFAATARGFARISRGRQPSAPPSIGRRSSPMRRTASRRIRT